MEYFKTSTLVIGDSRIHMGAEIYIYIYIERETNN